MVQIDWFQGLVEYPSFVSNFSILQNFVGASHVRSALPPT